MPIEEPRRRVRAGERRRRRKQRRTAVLAASALRPRRRNRRRQRAARTHSRKRPVSAPRKVASAPSQGACAAGADPRLPADRRSGQRPDAAREQREALFWRYPPGTERPRCRFAFDDDTFFGRTRDRIISNQEDQHTIQIISFPGRKVLWRYGHVNVKGSANGYLQHPRRRLPASRTGSSRLRMPTTAACSSSTVPPRRAPVRHEPASAGTTRPPSSARSTERPRSPTEARSSARSPARGSTTSRRTGASRWAVQAPVAYPSDPQPLPPGRILLAGLRAPGPRDHHDPDRSRALAVRTVLWPGRARSSLARFAHRSGPDRDQRRLPRPRRDRQHPDAEDRLAVRPYGRPQGVSRDISTRLTGSPFCRRLTTTRAPHPRAGSPRRPPSTAAGRPLRSSELRRSLLQASCARTASSRRAVVGQVLVAGGLDARYVDERRLPPRPRVRPACSTRKRPRASSTTRRQA